MVLELMGALLAHDRATQWAWYLLYMLSLVEDYRWGTKAERDSFGEVKEAHHENRKRGIYYIYKWTHSLTHTSPSLVAAACSETACSFHCLRHCTRHHPFFPSWTLSLTLTLLLISLKDSLPKRSPPYPKPNGFPLFPPNDKSYFSHLCKRHAARPKKTLPQSHWSKGPDPMHCTRVSMSLPYCMSSTPISTCSLPIRHLKYNSALAYRRKFMPLHVLSIFVNDNVNIFHF